MPLGLAGVNRSLPVAELVKTIEVPGGQLRVLMVVARRAGTGDLGYQMIARPLLERPGAVRREVDLVVLRPPRAETDRSASEVATRAVMRPSLTNRLLAQLAHAGVEARQPAARRSGRP